MLDDLMAEVRKIWRLIHRSLAKQISISMPAFYLKAFSEITDLSSCFLQDDGTQLMVNCLPNNPRPPTQTTNLPSVEVHFCLLKSSRLKKPPTGLQAELLQSAPEPATTLLVCAQVPEWKDSGPEKTALPLQERQQLQLQRNQNNCTSINHQNPTVQLCYLFRSWTNSYFDVMPACLLRRL